jgi:hypothetical protein
MTIRNDITVDFISSPRVITVASPSVELQIQDLVDTLRDIEDNISNMSYPKLINASGKEPLGSGVLVGVTAELQNAQVAFEARTTAVESGTVTTGGTNLLIDASATFVSNGIVRGSVVNNNTDGSVSEVVSVNSETEMSVVSLIGGVDNDFDIGDSYDVYNIVRCNISGGNLVGIDDVGGELDPVLPTAHTQVTRTLSSSATLLGLSSITSDVADAVWDEALADHTGDTTFGGFVQLLLKFRTWIGLK